MKHSETLERSFLYVPGDQRDHIEKAFTRGADALILDLEDAVGLASKRTARDLIGGWICLNTWRANVIWVRINADSLEEDIGAISGQIAGVMVPRAEGDLLAKVDGLLSAREAELGLDLGSISLIPLIETARGLLSAVDLASAPRVARLAIGRADLAGELGLNIDPEGPEFRSILLQLVIASSAAQISPPVAPTSTDFHDLEALRASTLQLMNLGFRSRTAIHPAQLAVINEVFAPSDDEVLDAQKLVKAFDDASRSGAGVIVDDEGRMVDAAVVRAARNVLARIRDSPSQE